ncbi:MAG TPA: YaiO family outer membrane beta-barrel protein [Lysobacter sp.]
MQRARALSSAERYEEAIALYSQALEQAPDDMDLRLARGRAYAWARRWPDAEADLLAVTAASPDYADAWAALGDMYLWSGRADRAVPAYGRWQALQPARPEPLLARSRAHSAAGDATAAAADRAAARALGADVAEPASDVPAIEQVSNPEAVAPGGQRWALQAEFAHTDFSGARASWRDRGLTVRRYFEHASVGLELLETERFGRDDRAIALDAYVDAWARAYANLRYQYAPDASLFPGHAWRAELFQGVGSGWELSASVDQLRFGSRSTDIYGVGLGHYVGRFYLRARTRYAPSSESRSHQAQVRYYYSADSSEYFEATVGAGQREDERVGFRGQESSRSLGLAFVRYPTPNLGFRVSASHADDTPDESRLGATVYYRW